MTGFRSERLDAMPQSLPLACTWNGIDGHVAIWHERGSSTGQQEGEIGDGEPLLVNGNSGSYLTGWPDQELLRGILGDQMDKAGITRHHLPDYLRMRRRGKMIFLTNYGPMPVTVPNSIIGEFVVGAREIPAAGVAILTED
jgi:beta-galactosidase